MFEDVLNLKYRDVFREYMQHFQENINLTEGCWMKDLLTQHVVSDEEVWRNIVFAVNKDKVSLLVQDLIKQGKITKYKLFLVIWQNEDPSKEYQFRSILKTEIKNSGLSEIDSQF